jgi:hypothetical protein
MKGIHHQDLKHNMEVSFMRKKNGDMPVGYAEQAALRREQCETIAENRNS